MGTLEQQTKAYEEAVVYIETLRTSDGPYKLSEGDKRQYQALINHSAHGAFRLAKQDAKEGLGTREKQAWEGLGNIPKTEAMRRLVEKSVKTRLEEGLAINAAKHQGN